MLWKPENGTKWMDRWIAVIGLMLYRLDVGHDGVAIMRFWVSIK